MEKTDKKLVMKFLKQLDQKILKKTLKKLKGSD